MTSKPSKTASKGPAAVPDAPVYHVDEDTQVDLLAQALLREYMHKKKFVATLAAFDGEHPRDENTVSSRAVMYDLMSLAATMPLLKGRGIETVMEALCYLRVVKRDNAEAVRRLQAELEAAKAEEAELLRRCEQIEAQARAAQQEAATVAALEVPKKKSKTAKTDGDVDGAEPKKKKKDKTDKASKKTGKSKLLSIEELLEKEDVLPMAKATSSVHSSQPSSSAPTPKHQAESSPTKSGQHSDGKEEEEEEEDEEDDYAAAIRKIRAEQSIARSNVAVDAKGRKKGWDDQPDHHTHQAAAESRSSHSTHHADNAHAEPSSESRPPYRGPLDGELGSVAGLDCFTCLTGGKRMLPQSFQQQGWYPTQTRGGPKYGLEQRLGGPCGVLAVVQARLLQRMLNPTSPTHGDFERSLAGALAATLAKIAMSNDSGRAVIVQAPTEDAWPSDVLPNSIREQKQWICLVRTTHVASPSASSVERTLASSGALKEWMMPSGSGLLCFLISCVLTRGGSVACHKDMDAVQPLIVEHGYCSQELTNLLLCGKCTSNALDGSVDLGGVVLRGYPGPLDVGFLTILESRGLMQAEKFAKYPTQCPATWVVFNESHYTVLFVKDTSIVAKSADARLDGLPNVVDVFYYDQQGQQDSEIRLTVTVPEDESMVPVPRITSRTSYVDVVIRTIKQWSKASVSWNGIDPLL